MPTSIELVTGAPANAAAGLPLPTEPSFVVKDQNGNAMAGVPVTIVVSGGGGTLANAPTVSASGPTSVGQWTLGRTLGANSLTIGAAGISPLTITVASLPGPAAKMIAKSPTDLAGTVGQPVNPLPAVMVSDAFDNPVPGAAITISLTGGGAVGSTSLTTDASGSAALPGWTLGTAKGPNTLTMSVGPIAVVFTAIAAPGALQTLAVVAGDAQSALAGTSLSNPIRVSPIDQYGNRLDNQVATFSIGAGGGSITSTTALSAPDGIITAPTWILGKSAVPQQLIATVGGKTATVAATVQTNYSIDIRFWGAAMTSEQQALFTGAAARIRGIVVGAVPAVDATGADPANCGVTGVPPLSEIIPGVVIYASIQDIDGKGKILAQAGPCYVRSSTDLRTVIGVMEFDAADISSLANGGSLIDVITHEMLHVVGVGSFWNDKGLLRNFNTSTVEYIGAGGIQGCTQTGGTTSCASAVPVENTGGAGTANSHWRESVFGSELMTGYANSGPMPLSVMTVRSIEDLGYTVNPSGADFYSIAIGSLRQNSESSLLPPVGVSWESGLPLGPFVLPRRGLPRNPQIH
ncbi:MAG: leishmanolysin-related zinc metalloendopeptidase [Gemmatimonadaceae bacterium]